MPVHVLSEGAGPGAQVPAHLTRISMSLISTSIDCSKKTVKVRLQQAERISFLHNDGNDKTVCTP